MTLPGQGAVTRRSARTSLEETLLAANAHNRCEEVARFRRTRMYLPPAAPFLRGGGILWGLHTPPSYPSLRHPCASAYCFSALP